MNRSNFWRFLLVVFVVLFALYELNPPTARDLIQEFQNRADARARSDTNFLAIVNRARELQAKLPDRAFGNLLEAIGTNSITNYFTGKQFNVANEKDPNRAILNRIQRDSLGKIKLGLDLQGGQSFLVAMDTNNIAKEQDRERVLSQAVEVLRRRVDKFGVAEPIIQPAGSDRILIQLPGLSQAETDSARKQIEKAAFLEFRMVHPNSAELIAQGVIEPGYEVLKEERRTRDGGKVLTAYLVKKKPEGGLTGKNIKSAMVTLHPVSNQPEIDFTLDSEGASIFAQLTRENIGRQLAIVLDGELYSAPVIQGEIPGGRGQITGQFDLKEAFELANVLENPLEAPVKIIDERSVDPSLGKDSIRAGVHAAVYGTVAVAVFMLVYYLLAGVVANIALILNIIILLGVMCSIGTTLTLPGIAGIVLTIGMAVDANVLIFERIREELAAGKSLRGAIQAGYGRAFGTIFDSNLTTLIASVLLIYLGTGPVKGFGVTLTIGIATSMLTALVVTRLIFDWLLARNLITRLPMLHIIRGTRFDFLRFAVPAFVASWMLIIGGCGYGVYRGAVKGDLFGVDFAGGDSLTLKFEQRADVDKIREALKPVSGGDPIIQYQKNIAENTETLAITVAYGNGDKVEPALNAAFPQSKFKVLGMDKVGPVVGREIQRTAIIAASLAMIGILAYVAFRYEFSFAVGAVVAIIHDLLMTFGVFSLAGLELSAPIVAAFLTIIGFSINDTIVIFDRIREDLKLGMRGSFKDIMNQALNQTLSRTIITSGTVFLATLSLYLFGSGTVKDFAFTFLIGILTGTYSSIYIASALVLWWHKGQRPAIGSAVTLEHAPAPVRA
jgi:SecD/SecF fusion protein